MKESLVKQYDKLLHKYNFSIQEFDQKINSIIKDRLKQFVDSCEVPAIWCYGKHTRMLMADFMFEMRKVRYIIDANFAGETESGFEVIRKEKIEQCHIDGVIISSFVYKDEIKQEIQNNYPDLKFLDIYQELEDEGIFLKGNYFSMAHPYQHYSLLNGLQQQIDRESSDSLFRQIVNEYVNIKDFASAISYAEMWEKQFPSDSNLGLVVDLTALLELEQEAIGRIDENNVLQLCIDGLRRDDLLVEHKMPKLQSYLESNGCLYDNAYSVSTSTYESLIPAYGENADLRTKYYESVEVPKGGCRYINKAIEQNRNIYFYTDSSKFIESDKIRVCDSALTVTEKIWKFACDAVDEMNGLFYMHILYESHYSYPNPYTRKRIIADGTNILFDYLSKNGGQIRTDYLLQQRDALRYVDDVLTPVLEKLNCALVLYADHGNILIEEGAEPEDLEYPKYTFHQDLIRVPLFIKASNVCTERNSYIISIMELNNILIGLLENKGFFYSQKDYIKVVRSKIYNPDFRYLYEKYGKEKGLQAFEVFIFGNGYKLAFYEDGTSELYTIYDRKIDDEDLKSELASQVQKEVTVWG